MLTKEFAPTTLAIDGQGNLYSRLALANLLVKLTPSGEIIAIAGSDIQRNNCLDFAAPNSIALDADNNLYGADLRNHVICKVTPAGVVSTFAGKAGISGVLLGALPGGLNQPASIAIGKRHGQPALFVLNNQRGSHLRGKRPSEFNVVTIPLL